MQGVGPDGTPPGPYTVRRWVEGLSKPRLITVRVTWSEALVGNNASGQAVHRARGVTLSMQRSN